tara:strand:+ start:12823 stop:13368 length:546 start_codon:yes stop_codon:yes gene_type:complete
MTTLFMVKPLGIGIEKLDKMGFINGFIQDVDHDCIYEDCVYLLFKPHDMDLFRDFIDSEYERTNNIVEDYDYQGGYVVMIYKLNPNFKNDYQLVRQGLYSKTSKDFQNLFPKIVKIMKNGKHRDEISLQYRIFNKTQDLITFWEDKLGIRFSNDQEVWEGFHEERETLNINNIKQYVEVSN